MAVAPRAFAVDPALFATAVGALDQGVLLVDGGGTVLAANPSAERILGFDCRRVCGSTDVPWAFVDEDGRAVDSEDLPCQTSLRTGTPQLGVVLGVVREDTTEVWVEFNACPSSHGGTPVAILSFADVTERRSEQQRLRELAERDTLTGLFNRRHFDVELRLQVERSRATGQTAALLLVDLDDLKGVNDTLGHAAGDRQLREAARRLRSVLRPGAVLARYGGDEFAIITSGIGAQEAATIAERLAATMADRSAGDRVLAPEASIGVAMIDGVTRSPAAALARVDSALYAAKQAGGGRSVQAVAEQRHVARRSARTVARVFDQLGGAPGTRPEGAAGIVAAARELLDMDIAYFTCHTAEEQIFRDLVGDGNSFGVGAGTRLPLAMTYCHQILEGRLPHLMGDLRTIPDAAAMPVTEQAGVGAYVSVPIMLPGGGLYGTLCCAAHDARPDLSDQDVHFLHVLARLVADHVAHEQAVVEETRLQSAQTAIRALIGAVQTRDEHTGEHSEVVSELVGAVAVRLGLDAAAAAEAQQVALLHDLGKIAVPDAILHKPGPLTVDEWVVMRTHPDAGADLVAMVPEIAHLADAIRSEHERWDGGGYPLGLGGAGIPQASRIVFVCDAYCAMTADRPYRPAMSHEEAVEEIVRCTETQFCPDAAAALLEELAVPRVLPVG